MSMHETHTHAFARRADNSCMRVKARLYANHVCLLCCGSFDHSAGSVSCPLLRLDLKPNHVLRLSWLGLSGHMISCLRRCDVVD